MSVAYFDFDGTITTKDTLLYFILHVIGYVRFLRLLPRIMIPALKYVFCRDNQDFKQRLLSITLKGYTEQQLEKYALSFAHYKLARVIKPAVYQKLRYHIDNQHTVVIVSANLAIYLRYFAQLHKIKYVIATELEFNHNKQFTGKLATPNCYGLQKKIRIMNSSDVSLDKFTYSYAYGNSRGDLDMLAIVDEPYMVCNEEISAWSKE